MNIASKLFWATRPAFLTITLLGCLLGIALPSANKESFFMNILGLSVALSAHAAANLFNDYFDHLNGSDQNNLDRISPFTGGSRFIQDQLLNPSQIAQLAVTLILLGSVIGLYICTQTTWLLIPLGLIGLGIAWAYSAPPLELMSRGVLGELAISVAWALVVIGFACVQVHRMAYEAIPLGLAYGLMVSNILLVNQIPDINADRLANKRTLASNVNSRTLSLWYTGTFITAYAFQIAGIFMGQIPKVTGITFLVLPIFSYCSKEIARRSNEKWEIKKMIVRNLLAIHLYSLLLLIGLFIHA
ncbi:prenyltransferase [Polynucleobacter sp. MWH-UH35A]|uniref:prenyltransferase n=1 Tax=Polynucleobacter sp. MWH-UH35A TaxID=1855619 RepID=UPI001BFD6FC9|nr:prenyltransferase [Polynucleobacter sp. MWH-UH35A]QWD60871.1 prenyltransferase [Polynucleobacter sp. MWH-UH35A]